MKDLSDAHGHVLWDHLNGRRAFEVIERDDGYIESFDSKTSPPTEDGRRSRGRRFDTRDGAFSISVAERGGMHSTPRRKGFDITGLDIFPYAITVCKLMGVKKVRLGSLHSLRFRPASFDTVIMFETISAS